MKTIYAVTIALLVLLSAGSVAGVILGDWERPAVDGAQLGYRGLGMEQVTNPRLEAAKAAANQVPEAQPPAELTGEKASEVYENVQVLGNLDDAEFLRLMAAITEWVAPEEQGCLYCHDEENLASDDVYTKVVSRRMLEMTRHINSNWESHVAETGVTCFTCHRGQPVPENVWFEDPGPLQAHGIGNRAEQNAPADSVALTSLPYDPFTPFLDEVNEIRVASTEALPSGNRRSIKQTEWTYGLMMHISDSLGVNCTYCHNTRSFFDWDASRPQRVTAWHGIQMSRELNTDYLEPLTQTFPAERLGPLGDVAKVNCATCHQGVTKPLQGVSMLPDYPELAPR